MNKHLRDAAVKAAVVLGPCFLVWVIVFSLVPLPSNAVNFLWFAVAAGITSYFALTVFVYYPEKKGTV